MYEKGQRVVMRPKDGPDKMVIIEDIIATDEGLQLKVKDPETHVRRMVDPYKQNIVEHLED